MPLNKVQLNPGINREVTKYTNEAGWRDCDKVRFKQGYPEKIGGWQRYGLSSFQGVCRSLLQWITLSFKKYIGVGTSVKFYVNHAGEYYDITPERKSGSLGASSVSPQNGYITTVNGSKQITLSDAGHGAVAGDTVEYSGITGGPYNGIPIGDLNTTHTIDEIVDVNRYKVTVATAASAGTAQQLQPSNGDIQVAYMLSVGPDFAIGLEGWNSQDYDDGTYGGDGLGAEELRVWSQALYGEDLVIGPRGGELYYWDASAGTSTRAIALKNVLNGAPVGVSITTNGNASTIVDGISNIDKDSGIRVGMVVTGTTSGGDPLFAANTRVVSISEPSGSTITCRLSAYPIDTGISRPITFDNNPISTLPDSRQIKVTDNSLLRNYKVGQHVTISGATGTIDGIAASSINGRHKIALVDEAAGTFTTEEITGIDPSGSSSSVAGGGGSVSVQYELSAEVPVVQNSLMVSDASRFVFAFGCNAFGDTTEAQNQLLLRWSDQENVYDWRPRSTNQAGDLQLSQGSEIVTAIQSRQEMLVFTDSALYSLQYVGAPVVWGSQLVGSNMSIASSKAVAYVNGVAYWMGIGKFYKYDGTAQPMRCDVRTYIFEDLDETQYAQVFAGTLEEYHEVWWFYCSKDNVNNVAPDKYVVYNYMDDIWYYGTMDRSAWLDSPLNDFPLAATSVNNLVEHEVGNDDGKEADTQPINAYIESGQFGIESGTSFTFIDKIIPDVSFVGSSSGGPAVTMSLLGASEPGAANNDPLSEGGNSSGTVLSQNTVEQYTEQLDTRVRGRQLAIKIESTEAGVAWQLGTPRLNMRPDGRRGK